MRFAALLLFSMGLLAQTPPANLLAGSWINDNAETPDTTQVVVRRDNGQVLVHAWGRCTPTDCDLGEVSADTYNGNLIANWNHGFSVVRMELIPLPDGHLLMAQRTEYRDGSGRTDRSMAEFFSREKPVVEGPEAKKARKLLHEMVETYRKLPAARFESIEIRVRNSGKTETRSEVRSTLVLSPPNRWRQESAPGGEPRVQIADGHTIWTVYPQSNQYQSTPQPPAQRPFDFLLLDRSRGEPANSARGARGQYRLHSGAGSAGAWRDGGALDRRCHPPG